MKILKVRKMISNAALQTELVEILKNMFLPSKKLIKEQIEWLIEHKYMKRDDDNINQFIYMAWDLADARYPLPDTPSHHALSLSMHISAFYFSFISFPLKMFVIHWTLDVYKYLPRKWAFNEDSNFSVSMFTFARDGKV